MIFHKFCISWSRSLGIGSSKKNGTQMTPYLKEKRDNNDAAYTYQGNRNPFIDQPEYVALIWGTTTPDTEAPFYTN